MKLMSFWSKFFIAFAITILATTGAVVGVFAGQKEQIDMGGSIKYTVPYFTVTFLNYDDTVFETQKVAYGQDATKPATDPTRPGYTFSSWTDYTNITQDRSVTANWIKNEAYLTTGAKWQAIVNASAVGANTNIEQIEFVSSVPSGATLIGSVGVTDETAATVWTENCGVFDVKAYYTTLSTGKYKILFYSPYTIYAPQDSGSLFYSSSKALTSLTSISFENFDTSKVTIMGYMFRNCSSLTSLNLSSFDMLNVTITTDMLSGCSALAEIQTPKAIGSTAVNLPTKTGYSWVDKTNEDNAYTQITVDNINKTLVLQGNKLTLTANANGGTIPTTYGWTLASDSKTATKQVTYHSTYGTLPTPTRTNAIFNGWWSDSQFGTQVTGDTLAYYSRTIYAHWIFTITLDSSGGTIPESADWDVSSDGTTATTQIAYGQTINNLPTPTKFGYTFNGWWTYQTGGTQIKNGQFPVESSLRIYAHWVAEEFTITIDANGGTIPATSGWTLAGDNKTATKGIAYNSTYGTLPSPTYSGHTFDGWWTAKSGGTKIDENTQMSQASNHTIFAHWINPSYLRKDWKDVLKMTNGNFVLQKFTSIEFTSTKPIGSGYTIVSVGANNMWGNGAYSSSANVVDVTAYIKANANNSTHFDLIFYSPVVIYAPVDSSNLFFTDMAESCAVLTSLSFKNFSTSNVTNMDFMLNFCQRLSSLDISNFDTRNVTSMNSLFYYCIRLESLDLSSFNMESVTNTNQLFYACNELKSIKTPTTMGNTVIDLFQIDDHSWVDQEQQTNFYTQLTSENTNKTLVRIENVSYLRKDWETALSNSNSNYTNANIKTILFTNTIPSGSGYTKISVGATAVNGETAFATGTSGVSDIIAYVKANGSLYDVVFYSPVKIYAPSSMGRLFRDLSNLTSISFENFDTSKSSGRISYLFSGCNSLTSLDLSLFDLSLTSGGLSIFPSSLTEIKTPKAIGSKAVDLPTKTGYSWVDKDNTSITYTTINSTNVGKTLILKAN